MANTTQKVSFIVEKYLKGEQGSLDSEPYNILTETIEIVDGQDPFQQAVKHTRKWIDTLYTHGEVKADSIQVL